MAWWTSCTAPPKTSAGITICQMRVMFSRSSSPSSGNIQAINSGVAVRGDLTGHDADRLGLVGHRDPLFDQPIQVAVLLVQVNVEEVLEGLGGACRLQRVVHRDRLVQGVEGRVEGSVVPFVGFSDRGGDRFEGGEDSELLPVGVPLQHLIEESEALDRGRQARLAAGGVQRRRVDETHVLSERIVDRHYRIDWTNHDLPPSLETK